jgi:hypothetical protein
LDYIYTREDCMWDRYGSKDISPTQNHWSYSGPLSYMRLTTTFHGHDGERSMLLSANHNPTRFMDRTVNDPCII